MSQQEINKEHGQGRGEEFWRVVQVPALALSLAYHGMFIEHQ